MADIILLVACAGINSHYMHLLLSSPEILLSQELSEVNACLSHAATVVTTKYKTSIVSDPAVEDSQVIWIYSQHVYRPVSDGRGV